MILDYSIPLLEYFAIVTYCITICMTLGAAAFFSPIVCAANGGISGNMKGKSLIVCAAAARKWVYK